MTEPAAPVQPLLRDHLAVAWVLVLTLLNLVPVVLWLAVSPLLAPWARARARRALTRPPPALADPPAPRAALTGRTVYVVAGEESGDRLLAAVVRAMMREAPGVRVRGLAGPESAAAGVQLDEELTRHAAFGIFGVARSVGTWWGICARTLARWRADPPDVLLTVDFPGLNVRLARWARARGVRTVHLVAPQIWAHAPWRILRWRRAVDELLAAYPFEPALFARSGIPTQYVGHPLFEAPLAPVRTAARRPSGPGVVVELWPGSRARELKRHVPMLLEAAARLEARCPDLAFRVPLARETQRPLFDELAQRARARPTRLEVSSARPQPDAQLLGALATSGTATAELAVAQVPIVVFYRLGLIEYLGSFLLLTCPFIALPNLVLGRGVVPERLVWRRAASAWLAREFLAQVQSPESWQRARAALGEVRTRLESHDVARRAARRILTEPEQTVTYFSPRTPS